MKLRKLVSTYELPGVHLYTNRDRRFDLRIDIFASLAGEFTCRVWIIEEFRIVPTDGRYNEIRVDDREFYADKLLATVMDANAFDEIQGASEEEVRRKALDMIHELFDVSDQP